MELKNVLKNIDYKLIKGSLDKEVLGITLDSRSVKRDFMFVCIKGLKTDGHKYVNNALELGASVIVCQDDIPNLPDNIIIIKVNNSRKTLPYLADNFYNHPSDKMTMIGVTGTNGKTTTTYLIRSVLNHLGKRVGVVGTIENLIGDKHIHTERTTPEATDLCELFDTMVNEGVSHTVMEVSSHSLDLNRVDFCRFKVGIFTNLTQDHLDYHETMENYKKAKSILFSLSDNGVINIDDDAGEYMVSCAKGKVITFGIDREADLRAKDYNITADGVDYTLVYENKEYTVNLKIPGKFSIYNSLGAIGACIILGIPMEIIIEGIDSVKGVAGRFQTVKSHKGFNAIVDYAHTPDGLLNILNTAREFVKGDIITVFGCGGDRDKTKRPIMGDIAGRLSDYCIITSDNPRTEEPIEIIKDVEVGTAKTGCSYECICDRREAIKRAVEIAKAGDVVVIAGKGHEDYQIFKDKTIHFDDVEEVKSAMGEL